METKKKSSGGWLHGFIFGFLLSIAFNILWNYLYPKLQVRYGLEWNRDLISFCICIPVAAGYAYYLYKKNQNAK